MSIKVALEHRTTYSFDRPVRAGPARRPAAPGAALAHADRGVHAGRHARRGRVRLRGDPLRQLAAGPVRQLDGPAGVPRAGQGARRHGRPRRRPGLDQPLRLLRRGVRRALPVRLRARAGRRSRPVPAPGGRRTAATPRARWSRRGATRLPRRRPGRCPDRHLPGQAQRRGQPRRRRTRCAWSPACRRPTRRSAGPSARAATARGCWSRCCGSTASRPASCPATWCS